MERERYNGVLFHKFCYNVGEKCSSFLWDFVLYKGFFCFFTENLLYRGSLCGSFVSQALVIPGFRNSDRGSLGQEMGYARLVITSYTGDIILLC